MIVSKTFNVTNMIIYCQHFKYLEEKVIKMFKLEVEATSIKLPINIHCIDQAVSFGLTGSHLLTSNRYWIMNIINTKTCIVVVVKG